MAPYPTTVNINIIAFIVKSHQLAIQLSHKTYYFVLILMTQEALVCWILPHVLICVDTVGSLVASQSNSNSTEG